MKKLTQTQADEIRRLRQHTNMSLRDLAHMYGVTKGNVNHIIQQRIWNKETP